MSNNENLKPFTKENAKQYGKKGGIKSGKVRAERKSIKEQLSILLELPITNKEKIQELSEIGFSESEMNNQLYLTYSLFEKALLGDIKATTLIFKTIQKEDEEKSNSFNDALNDMFNF